MLSIDKTDVDFRHQFFLFNFTPNYISVITMKKSIFLLLSLVSSYSAFSNVVINEILASNNGINTDPDYNEYADWVELFNNGKDTVDLSGYFLTDNLDDPTKFTFPVGTKIAPNAQIMIWCDGNDSGLHTSFKLSADGEELGLFDSKQTLLDSVTFGPQYIDISFGRTVDGSSFRYFKEPTPNEANTTKGYIGKANQPMILTQGGFYTSSVDVEITNDLGGEVRYTTDGTEPTETSALYESPINLTKTTVVRARIFDGEKMPGNVMTASYFIDDAFKGHDLPIVSIATDPRNFWDSTIGIYTQDFKPEWEIPVNIEMFENNGSDRAKFNSPAGVKINGLAAWQLPQKMLGVYFKKKHGESKLETKLFHDDNRSSFKNFSLRASGTDWCNTLIRDGLGQQACRKAGVGFGLMAFRPSVVYVNGEFLGIHNIREKVDADYIAQHYGLASSEFDMIENWNSIENGSLDSWIDLIYLYTKDLSVEENYAAVEEKIDIENFTDFAITEIYSLNRSLDHNLMAWKPKHDGKWNWILMDLDRGFFLNSWVPMSYFVNQEHWPLQNLLANDNYKKYFAQRMADRLFASFNPDDMVAQTYQHKADIDPLIDKHLERWKGTTSDWGNAIADRATWENEIEKIVEYLRACPAMLLNELHWHYNVNVSKMLSFHSEGNALNEWSFNGLKSDLKNISGLYPEGLDIKIEAKHKDGYNFVGWKKNTVANIISKEDTWKFFDKGTDQGSAWKENDFNDSEWIDRTIKEFTIPENTSNRATFYYRKHVTLDSTTIADIISAKINILRQNGGIVWINGKEAIRTNMPLGEINYNTECLMTADTTGRNAYVPFSFDPSLLRTGDNVIAVELHHLRKKSVEKIFDMELVLETAGKEFIETSPILEFTMDGHASYTAAFEKTTNCVVPDSILEDMTLSKECSPYIAPENVYVAKGVRLTIEPGVVVNVSPNVNFYVNGAMTVDGTATDSILFQLNPAYDAETEQWGAINFIHTGDMKSTFKYVEIKNASNGPGEYNCVAAISGFDTDLNIDHVKIVDINANPIALRYGSMVVTNSVLHSNITGDLINIKYGKGRVENTEFIGNDMPDSDAIDYDGVDNGIIRNCTIRHLLGDNSDAIDLGEQAHNVVVDSIMVFNITDKGISVGQRSNVILSNSTFIQTNLGVGVKDSCSIYVDHCTFYAVANPIACYEKVEGRGGGNATVRNSIISNSYDMTVLCDERSHVDLKNNIYDTDTISAANGNIFDSPEFKSAAEFLITTPDSKYGSNFLPIVPEIEPVISEICYAPNVEEGQSEYIKLYNPGDTKLDISGYVINKGITFTFPKNAIIESKSSVIVAKSSISFSKAKEPVYEWEKGNLANEGESIRITKPNGIVVDQVTYSTSAPWPEIDTTDAKNVLTLTTPLAANNWAKNWSLTYYTSEIKDTDAVTVTKMYYNHQTRTATFSLESKTAVVRIYTATGVLLEERTISNGQSISLKGYPTSVLFISIDNKIYKVL